MINNLAVLAPREHKNLMIEQGSDRRTATIETYVEICERAETKEDAHKETKGSKKARFESDDESDSSYKKKKNKKEYRKREEHFCKYHGPNPTHDSDTCKVLLAKGQDKPAWKDNKKDYKDFKSKYKNKSRDLNILQKEVQQTKNELQKE
jgi:hypothetical protein